MTETDTEVEDEADQDPESQRAETEVGKRNRDKKEAAGEKRNGGKAEPQVGCSGTGDPRGGLWTVGRTGGLTLSSSSGRSPPSLMPRFMATKRSRPGLSRTLGLCRLVFSMITAKDST